MTTLPLSQPHHTVFVGLHGLAETWEQVLTLLAAWAERQPPHHRLGRWTAA